MARADDLLEVFETASDASKATAEVACGCKFCFDGLSRAVRPGQGAGSVIAAVRPIRLAAVLVPIIEREQLSVLFTQRTAHLEDHAGQISFPGGKIDAVTRAQPPPRSARRRRRSRLLAALSSRLAISTFT